MNVMRASRERASSFLNCTMRHCMYLPLCCRLSMVAADSSVAWSDLFFLLFPSSCVEHARALLSSSLVYTNGDTVGFRLFDVRIQHSTTPSKKAHFRSVRLDRICVAAR